MCVIYYSKRKHVVLYEYCFYFFTAVYRFSYKYIYIYYTRTQYIHTYKRTYR